MLPKELKPEQFSGYPPQARHIAVAHIGLLQQLPLAFLPLLLRELIAYDWKFPAERKELDHQLSYLSAMTAEQLRSEMAVFEGLHLSPDLERVDWVNAPAQFSEKLSAHLWTTHQIDAFRAASIEYVRKMNAAATPQPAPIARLGVVMIGQGVGENQYRLFRKLRAGGRALHGRAPGKRKASFIRCPGGARQIAADFVWALVHRWRRKRPSRQRCDVRLV